jgi:hypothetical protein
LLLASFFWVLHDVVSTGTLLEEGKYTRRERTAETFSAMGRVLLAVYSKANLLRKKEVSPQEARNKQQATSIEALSRAKHDKP